MPMTPRADIVRFSAASGMPGVELVSALYARRAFPAHSHPEYVIGAVVGGAEALQVGRRTHAAPAGTALFLNPEQTHSNVSVGNEPLAYRVMYVPPAVIDAWLPDGLDFQAPVSRDARIFELTVAAHETLAKSPDRFEQESAFAALLDCLVAGGGLERRLPSGDAAIGRVARPSPRSRSPMPTRRARC